VTATIGVGAYPTAMAVDPAAGSVYVTNSGYGQLNNNTVSVIDAATSTVTSTVPLPVASFPDAVAVDPGTDTAYVANSREPGVNDGTVSVITAVKVRTALTASIHLSPHRTVTLIATLTADGRRLRGQPISFTSGRTLLCAPHTSTRGVATCVLTPAQARRAARDHRPIRASYPGNARYQPSSATATGP
jgi:YVTN family beta-propeller protein